MSDPTGAAPRPVACSTCGRLAPPDGPPLTWMTEFDQRRGTVFVCEQCARTHARAIEAKLDQEWW